MKIKATDATYARVDGQVILRYDRHFVASMDRVWAALTEPDELARWLAAAAVDLTVGGELMLHWLTEHDGDETVLNGVITELEPRHRLGWATDLQGSLGWELWEEPAGTTLTLTVTTADAGDHLARTLASWHVHLDHLEDALAGAAVDWSLWTPTTHAAGSGLSWTDHWTRYTARSGSRR